MSVDQIVNNEGEHNPLPLAPTSASEITGGVLDMDVLNAFEDLQSGDGSDLIVELIDLYLVDAAQRVSQIREASAKTEWVLLKRAAHNLKGSSSNLGIRKVAELCQKLEWMDRHDSPETVADLVRLLEHESAQASAALTAVRQRRVG